MPEKTLTAESYIDLTPTIESYVNSLMKSYPDKTTHISIENVISQLKKINDKCAAEALVSIIKDESKDYTVRGAACDALRGMECVKGIGLGIVPDLIPALMGCINYQEIRTVSYPWHDMDIIDCSDFDAGAELRSAAIYTSAELMMPWTKILESSDIEQRERAEKYAVRENFDIEPLVREIINALYDKDEWVCRRAEYTLMCFGRYSIRFLVKEAKELSSKHCVGLLIEKIRELSEAYADSEKAREYLREKIEKSKD